MTSAPLPVALTMGDPAGICPEITFGAWAGLRPMGGRPFYVIGCPQALRRWGPVAVIENPAQAAAVFSQALPVLPEPLPSAPIPGTPNPSHAMAQIRSIERAVRAVQQGQAAAVCTNPINKKALRDGAGFAYPGHTEFLSALDGGAQPVMMLTAPADAQGNPGLRVVPVTIHIPLADVPRQLTTELIISTARITVAGLRRDFGIANPRLAVAGLNPHAGEGGQMGTEDQAIIAPAVTTLQAMGIAASGPLPADTLFHARARAGYDVALCMYHDQGLIPVKMLGFDDGVNVTLGLRIIRTSPDHGTAYDIAGQGLARPNSLMAALKLADQMAQARGTA